MNNPNKTTMLPTIMKCPFCGTMPILRDKSGHRAPPFDIICTECQCCLWPSRTAEDAIKAWNARTPISNDALYGYSKVTNPAYKAEQKTRNQEMREAVDSMSGDAISDSNHNEDKLDMVTPDAVEVAARAIDHHFEASDRACNIPTIVAQAALSAAYPALVKERDALYEQCNALGRMQQLNCELLSRIKELETPKGEA